MGLIQSEEFKTSIEAVFTPIIGRLETKLVKKFEELSEQMTGFRDEVLTREDATCKELRIMRDELASFSLRISRVERQNGITPAIQIM